MEYDKLSGQQWAIVSKNTAFKEIEKVKTMNLHEISNELTALDDWLGACREQIAELSRELKATDFLESPQQCVSQCLASTMNIGVWRKLTRREKDVIN